MVTPEQKDGLEGRYVRRVRDNLKNALGDSTENKDKFSVEVSYMTKEDKAATKEEFVAAREALDMMLELMAQIPE